MRARIRLLATFAALAFPALAQINGDAFVRDPTALRRSGPRAGVKTSQAVDDLVAELVPLPLRGKELKRWSSSTGANSVLAVEYENVTLAEEIDHVRTDLLRDIDLGGV